MSEEIQHKPAHVANVAFNDDGEPVPVAVDSPLLEPRDRVEELLLESGVANSALVDRILALVEDLARERAGEAIHAIAAKLDGTSAGIALRRVLCGSNGASLADSAAVCGVSKVAIFKQEKLIRAKLGLTNPT